MILIPSPETGGTVEGYGTFACNTLTIISATANVGYEFINWTDTNGIVISDIPIFEIMLTQDSILIAHFEAVIVQPVDTIKFTILASKHSLVDPRKTDYAIPIYIKADKDISNTVIDSLVIEIDGRIFYPRRVDKGDMSLHFKDTVIKMTFENVTVPTLLANKEEVLLTIRGDVLLGEIDSSEIKIDAVKFAEQLSEKPDLIHGFITLDICAEGANRVVWFDYSPEVIVKNNPVIGGILELQCKTIERGSYSLEIVDLQGSSTIVETWTVAGSTRIFDFEIDVSNFAIGSYFIVLNTPTNKYSAGFVITK